MILFFSVFYFYVKKHPFRVFLCLKKALHYFRKFSNFSCFIFKASVVGAQVILTYPHIFI
ncbi:MAG: hypothetical protein US76_01510 [Parcubacteria group bacterium GW2011_GWA2_38_13b]|nr:MAG: hypothetical protein US76_01510 [Parcubacteria group bacterium GW2011_GWA2_38_13b]